MWSDSSTSQTITINSSDTISVHVIDTNGCLTADTIFITVNPNPALNLGNDTFFCQGNTFILDAENPAASYLWQDSSIDQTYNVIATGQYFVKVTDANGCTADDTVTISELPALPLDIGSDTSICSGDTFTLDAGSGYSSYLWSDSSTSQTITINSSDTISVHVIDTNGCLTADTIFLIVYQVFTTNDLASICQGDSIVLGGAYQTTSGTYYDTSITINDCDSVIVTTLIVNSLPFITNIIDTPMQGNNNGAINLTVTGATPPYAFLWDNGDTTEDIDSLVAGTYQVVVTDSLGCIDSASIEVLEITGIIQSSLINIDLKIYPNPNNGNFQINYQIPAKQDGAFVIYDVMGRKLKTWQLAGGKNKLYITDIKLNNGLYFYQVIVNDGVIKSNKLLVIK
ncbi:MAG: T9SS type A sorting domain-containing protein [Cytophagales bacterium]|nr:T9SS type A sorting domain-containing protein [Cytophagales bacterium]